MSSSIHLIDYIGHNLTEFSYKNNQKGLLNKNKKHITDLKFSYDISEGDFTAKESVVLILVNTKLIATSEDGYEIFKLDVEYQSLFTVGEAEGIEEKFLKENEWFFTKFIHRSGKRILETLLSNTEYKNLHVPSFLRHDQTNDESS